MKLNKFHRLAAAGVIAGLLGLALPAALVQAADTPSFPAGSAGDVYLVNGKTNQVYAAGSELAWDETQGVFLSATSVASTPADSAAYEALRLPAPTDGATTATTFLAAPGHEATVADWKAYSDPVPLNSKGVLLPQVTPSYQAYGAGLADGLGALAVKATGGTYSLGVAYLKGSTVVKTYYTTIAVTSGSGAFKFATPGAVKTASSTALAAAPTSSTFGTEVTLTATVSPSAATGSVDFYEGSTKLGTGSLASGVASFSTSALTVGSHTVKAVYAGDDTYATSTSANATVTVTGATFTAATPTISGTVSAGNTVTAVPGTWTPAPTTTTYAWLLDGAAIAGATSPTLVVNAEWGGKQLAVSVTGSKNGYATATKTSAAIAVPKSSFTKSSTPTISGTAKVGKTLKAKAGIWSPTAAFSYQWYANGKAIKGATKSSYKIAKSYKGKKLTVKVTASKAGYDSKSRTSKATKKVAK
ncbi:MAG: hypothetical protein CVT62_04480 [Actinobacteria bacterium HGW-Actinobacteria-2]|nr:MAG: hypothetical protein CVT62_04480 [Actinobacteria bacterium HGW-Actinobacteria-2]